MDTGAAVTYETYSNTSKTITPNTTVRSDRKYYNTSTYVSFDAPENIASNTTSAGSIDMTIGYTDILGTQSFTSLATASIPWSGTLDTLKTTTVTWTPSSFTLPAKKILGLKVVNNLTITGNGSCYIAVEVRYE